jgi:hypothetical protein
LPLLLRSAFEVLHQQEAHAFAKSAALYHPMATECDTEFFDLREATRRSLVERGQDSSTALYGTIKVLGMTTSSIFVDCFHGLYYD